MSDIVERLRAYSSLSTDGIPIYDEAADEIERLRVEVEALKHRDIAEKENEALRAALSKLREVIKAGSLVPLDGYSDDIAALNFIDRTLEQKLEKK